MKYCSGIFLSLTDDHLKYYTTAYVGMNNFITSLMKQCYRKKFLSFNNKKFVHIFIKVFFFILNIIATKNILNFNEDGTISINLNRIIYDDEYC